jgi:hypothetical protein
MFLAASAKGQMILLYARSEQNPMAGRFKIIILFTGLSLILSSASFSAQLLNDTSALSLIRKNVDHIYNMQHDEANEIYSEITKAYPNHPIVYLLRGIMTYWENYPLLYTAPAHISFEEDLRQSISLAENNHNPEYEAEYLLTNLCARAMLLMFYADNEITMEVIPLTISTYKCIRRSFDFTSASTDLYYFTGLYNYYREAYPRAHPIYKSLALLFPQGDIETGLNELKTASTKSVVLRAESCFILAWIYLYYENIFPDALYYCKTLHNKYPANELYFAMYIKNLLIMRQYDDAENLITAKPDEEAGSFLKAQLAIFRGILQEKKYNNLKLAEQHYNEGIRDLTPVGKYGNEYAAYGYFGLSRISEARGENKTRKTYRREAIRLTDYKKINFDD